MREKLVYYNFQLYGRECAKRAMVKYGLPKAIANARQELGKYTNVPNIPEIRESWLKGYMDILNKYKSMIEEI